MRSSKGVNIVFYNYASLILTIFGAVVGLTGYHPDMVLQVITIAELKR